MAISSTYPTSRRMYLSIDELEQYADITVTDNAEANDQISQAEEAVDTYIRRGQKFMPYIVEGKATDGSTTTLIDTSSDNQLEKDDNFFLWCELEILHGTNAGERRRITASDKDTKTITVESAFTSSIDTTSFYRIHQLGLFPRSKDVIHDGDDSTYYKSIPEAIKRATAFQVKYMIDNGAEFFSTGADFKSETIGDYSYSRQDGVNMSDVLIAPKAREILKPYMNRIGQIVA